MVATPRLTLIGTGASPVVAGPSTRSPSGSNAKPLMSSASMLGVSFLAAGLDPRREPTPVKLLTVDRAILWS